MLPTKSEAIQLKEQILNGSDEAKETLILKHIRLAKAIARGYGNDEELVSVAYAALVEGVNNIENCKHGNLTGFLSTYMHLQCIDFLRTNSSVSVPSHVKPIKTEILRETVVSHDFKLTEDIFKTLIQTDLEKQIYELRYEGYSDKEISNLLNITQSKISRIKKTLQQRYNRHNVKLLR